MAEFDYAAVFDNTDIMNPASAILVLETVTGHIIWLGPQVPAWTLNALRGTAYEVTEQLRQADSVRTPPRCRLQRQVITAKPPRLTDAALLTPNLSRAAGVHTMRFPVAAGSLGHSCA